MEETGNLLGKFQKNKWKNRLQKNSLEKYSYYVETRGGKTEMRKLKDREVRGRGRNEIIERFLPI